ncbi:hypothetical protein WJX81_001332 [Elliptochloris bilobata]|uniref:Glycosyl hydrolase family 43 protein n=1 Tax=Elliptochloris bilobata TaxID=381761 RepID=A0AAW1RJ08_9CHLO
MWLAAAKLFVVTTHGRDVADFHPGEKFRDTNSELIQAHGGGILYHDSAYYWYGENKDGPTYTAFSLSGSPARVDVIGVSCYSSRDLVSWRNEGVVLRGGTHPDLAPHRVVERPKVLWNEVTRQFVMWVHVDDANYETACVGVATSPRATGPFAYRGSFRPHGQQSRDLTLFQDDDGVGYIAYSSEDNRVMHIGQLTRDFTAVQAKYVRALVGLSREAPSMFKAAGHYFLLTSGCTGWEPNRAEVFHATSPMGEWRSLGNPCVGGSELDMATTFFSQATAVLPLPGQPGRILFMADQWDVRDLGRSRYVWLPLWVLPLPALEPGPPVDVVVRWHDSWHMTDFEKVPRPRKVRYARASPPPPPAGLFGRRGTPP